MDEDYRNKKIGELLVLWEWCSRTLHVKWERKHEHRNTCLMGLTAAVNEGRVGPEIAVPELPLVYKSLPTPLFKEAGVLVFWEIFPTALFEMAIGCFTKGSPLAEQLNQLRLTRQDNVTLDKLFKKMHGREERFGSNWLWEGHHPESEFVQLEEEMAPLCEDVEKLLLREHAVIETLAHEVLSNGPWQFGDLSAYMLVRKTPESLLNRAIRLKLWLVAQEILYQNLDEDEQLELLCDKLTGAITPSVKTAIEAQGYTVDKIVDDFLNFDMHKSREEITEK